MKREDYIKLLTKLHNTVLVMKYKIKDNIKLMERTYITRKPQPQSHKTYKQLFKKLDLTKKVLAVWENFET